MPASNIDKPIEAGPHPLNLRDEAVHATNIRLGRDGKPLEAFTLPNIEKPEAQAAPEEAAPAEKEAPSPISEEEHESLAAGVKEPESEEEVVEETEERERPKVRADVQKRIDREVRLRRETERRMADLQRQYDEAQRHLQGYRQRIDYSDLQAVTAREEHIKSATEAAQAEYLSAATEVDNAKMLKATRRLAELAADQKEIDIYKRQRPFPPPQREQPQQAQPQQEFLQPQRQQQRPQDDELALEWADGNKWFGKDRALTSVAYAIDAELKEEGIDPNSRRFWTQLNKRLREEMPHKFQVERRPPTQPVTGASRAPARSSNGEDLSDSQKEMARRLGVPTKLYAKYVPKG